ncbi:hypothetical protein EMMF5_006299 [Cystobasidiomycetes sp. EMM_F5]
MACNWEAAKYCSNACRSKRPSNKLDKGIEASFLRMLLAEQSSSSGLLCEAVQAADGPERTTVDWRERYRRAARRLANIYELCDIEHYDKGKWQHGDGKGEMRVRVHNGKAQGVRQRLEELAADNDSGQRHDEDTRQECETDDESGNVSTGQEAGKI